MSFIRRILYCLFFLLLSGAVLADTFVVTNTNNSGPGSLRDALENAERNGTGVRDFINFNIPSNRGPAIIKIPVDQLLPALSSNLVIDGSTQPGLPLGASGAKLTLSLEGRSSSRDYLVIFQLQMLSQVEIYGLALLHQVVDPGTGLPPPQLHAIVIRGGSDLKIGARGKGNVISGWTTAILAEDNPQTGAVQDLSIKGNILGLDTDGVSTTLGGGGRGGGNAIPAANNIGISIATGIDTEIGGVDLEEGNVINSRVMDIFSAGRWWYSSDNTMTISHNRIGYDITNKVINASAGIGIYVRKFSKRFSLTRTNLGILIDHNRIGSYTRTAGIIMDSIQTFFAIENNIIGGEIDDNPPTPNGYAGIGISLTECDMGIIGGENFGRENIIRYWKGGAFVGKRTSNITFRYNSTYCNNKRALALLNWKEYNPSPYRTEPKVTINYLNLRDNVIEGTATPNTWVDLYMDDHCPDCEGKEHIGGMFAVIPVGPNGVWNYSDIPFGRGNFVVTATDNYGTTSEYSRPEIDTTAIRKTAVRCKGQGGSICGLKITSGTEWEWLDSAGNKVGSDTCLTNVPPGRYYFHLSIGPGYCQETWAFRIIDSTLDIDSANGVTVLNTRCGRAMGSIRGFTPANADRWQWEDASGTIVGTGIDLLNVRAGRYRFRVFNSDCDTVTAFYEVSDITPSLDASAAVITATTCNLPNGSIRGLRLSGAAYSYSEWVNDSGRVVGTRTDLENIGPGRYKFILRDVDGYCGDSTGYFTVTAVPAPSLNIVSPQITAATCGNANGTIANISYSGTTAPVTVIWENEAGQVVGTNLLLTAQRGGRYRIKVKDAGPCDTLRSPYFTIPDLGSVNIDSSAVLVKDAGCTRNNGSITGLRVNGTTQWDWVNTATGNSIGQSLNVYGLAAGSYRLIAVNNEYGCRAESPVYTIRIAPALPLTVQAATVTDATCNTNNGTVTVSQFSHSLSDFTLQWLKDSTQSWGSNLQLTGLAPASYHLIATDTNGCTRQVYKAVVRAIPLPVMDERNAVVSNDTCAFNTGGIRGITAISDAGNLSYAWKNETAQTVGNTVSLTGVQPGRYQLEVRDGNGCILNSAWYTVAPVVTALPVPVYDPQTIPRYGAVTVRVKQLYPGGTYTLYDPSTGATLQRNTSGVFTLSNVANDLQLAVKVEAGPCSSAAGGVSVKVIDITQLDIPNAFSPNGDGINDQFRIRVTGYFKLDGLLIFNRWGQKVFDTKDINREWTGTLNGNPLAVGTYYYIIEGIDVKGEKVRKSGSITLLR